MYPGVGGPARADRPRGTGNSKNAPSYQQQRHHLADTVLPAQHHVVKWNVLSQSKQHFFFFFTLSAWRQISRNVLAISGHFAVMYWQHKKILHLITFFFNIKSALLVSTENCEWLFCSKYSQSSSRKKRYLAFHHSRSLKPRCRKISPIYT